MISSCGNIVFFGGAGVSTESGIPDFRSAEGLFRQQYPYPPETILSRDFFDARTRDFFDFYREKMIYLDARPGKAHIKLAELEKSGRLKTVITQNIDGLHQKAGSKNVLELHGSVHRNICRECLKVYDAAYIFKSKGIPVCICGGQIKPDVVLYGEPLDSPVCETAMRYIEKADMLIVGGTSLAVYPAAGFISCYRGNKLILINKTPTPYDHAASHIINDSIGEVLEDIVV